MAARINYDFGTTLGKSRTKTGVGIREHIQFGSQEYSITAAELYEEVQKIFYSDREGIIKPKEYRHIREYDPKQGGARETFIELIEHVNLLKDKLEYQEKEIEGLKKIIDRKQDKPKKRKYNYGR